MTDRELMQMALDALEGYARNCRCEGGGAPCDAAEALRARLAQPEQEPINYEEWNYNPMTGKPLWYKQPEQEPVAWVCYGAAGKHDIDFDEDEIAKLPVGTMLYTAPPQREWQGLTEDEVQQLFGVGKVDATFMEFTRAIEAKLKEKNA